MRRLYAAVAGLLQLPLQLIAIHRLDGDFTGELTLTLTRLHRVCHCCK